LPFSCAYRAFTGWFIDISAVPSEVLNVVISVVCRLTFDFAMWSTKPIPITIVCEEAHRYAPRNREAGFEPAKRALSRIAITARSPIPHE
jgi:hypothetical protein